MTYRATVRGESFRFADLRELLAKANEPKSGDQLAGIAAGCERERVAAKLALADVCLADIAAQPLIEDEVTALVSTPDSDAFGSIASLTVGELRERVLGCSFSHEWSVVSAAITPEIAAACAKLMGNLDLAAAAAPLHVVTTCRSTLGQARVLGARIQPNHPADDVAGILLSALDGLAFGCGDALIGVNPATDAVPTIAAILRALHELIAEFDIPTQACVLAHPTTQLAALEACAPVDLFFASVAGTEGANRSFGVSGALLAAGCDAVREHHAARPGQFPPGHRFTYFETGQGSALSAGAHHGIDQLTLEARAQAFASRFEPFLINSVVGFIGPEYLADATQIARAGLEDHFVGKLMGIPTGVDVCYTNHADADQNSNDSLLIQLAAAGCAFVMGVPGGDDVMLGYQSTSYHDVATIRRVLGLRPAPEFEAWLTRSGLWQEGEPCVNGGWPESLLESVRLPRLPGAARALSGGQSA